MLRTDPPQPGRADRPVWRDCLAHFRREIREGRIAPGTRLPSLAQLETRFDLTRFGARQLIDAMKAEGLVQSWHGRGTYVAERPIHYRISSRTRFSTNVTGEGRTGKVDMLDRGMRKAQGSVARMLGIDPGTPVPFALLLGYLDDRPAVLGQHSFAPDLPEDVLDVLEACDGSVSRTMARLGLPEFRRDTTLIEARLPSRHEALTLDVPPSQPVIVTTALNVDGGGRKLEISKAVARADLIAFVVPAMGAGGIGSGTG
ncbi:putative transcriptional regulator PhnF [Marinibacterium anthonyi]|nr:putative transcriptional regulator PhnF [Marinibacterium anthonyi]